MRELLGETQTHFGDQIGVVQSTISKAEKDLAPLSDEALVAIAARSDFPVEFFGRPPSDGIPDVQFRARLRFAAKDRDRVVQAARLVHESYGLMLQHALAVPVSIPDCSGMTPEYAAEVLRSEMGVAPHVPLPNLTLLVERLGAVVLALPVDSQKHDAFSWWQVVPDTYPVIATLRGAPGDRLRWNIAHELGHICLRHGQGFSREMEDEANYFAAALLTPLKALRREMSPSPKLSSLYALKVRWGVSVQSLIRRARALGYVGEDQYFSLFRQISARGERMNEKVPVRLERPRAYRKLAEVVFGPSIIEGLSGLAAWSLGFTERVLTAYATASEVVQPTGINVPGSTRADVIPIRRRA